MLVWPSLRVLWTNYLTREAGHELTRPWDLAASDVFPEARPGVARIALLITDGKQTEASDAKGLREASAPLRKAGVRVMGPGRWLRGGRRPTKVDNRD